MLSIPTNHPLPHTPCLVTSLPGPKARALIERDHAVTSPSYTRDYPLVAARAAGCTIEDVDGNVFLDMTAGIAVTSTLARSPRGCQSNSGAGGESAAYVGD